MKSAIRAIVVSVALLAPVFASAAVSGGITITFGNGGGWGGGCASTVCGIASTIISLINSVLVPTLFALAFIVFLYGVAKAYIFSHGDPGEVQEGHKLILWGLIGFAVMISLWGLVNVVSNTFGLQGAGAPSLPTSYQQ